MTIDARSDSNPSGAADLGPVLEFMRLVWRVDHQLHRVSKRMLATRGVTGPQRLVLRVVSSNPAISAGDLARVLHLHPSTLTGILRRLQKRRLLHRSGDASDGRRALFELTPNGAHAARSATGTVEAAVRNALRQISKADVHTAGVVLERLATELAKYGVD